MEHKKFKHNLDNHDCSEMGFSAEVIFKQLAEKKGYSLRIAGREEQFSHVDFILNKDGKEWRVDVKGAKRKKRTDESVDYSVIWLEFLNGHGGEGWLTKEGGCSHIAFELENEFLLVGRKDLKDLSEKLCDLEKKVDSAKKALYCGYKRFGRRDLLSLIKTEDLRQIQHSIWPKNP
jgi:hypothetical protein